MHPSYEDRPGAPDACFADRPTTRLRARTSRPGRARWPRPEAADQRRAAPPPPDAAVNEAAARVAPGRPGRRAPARHRAADARGDRGRAATGLDARRRLGGTHARLGAGLRAAAPARRGAARARRRVARRRSRPLHRGAQRLRPRGLRSRRGRRPRRVLGASTSSAHRGAGAPGRGARERRLHGLRRSPPLLAGPVLVACGRFTAVKRVPLLIEAVGRDATATASLVLLGGHPGEWEGEHPSDAVAAHRGAQRVPGRLARPRRAAGLPARRRRARARLGARAVRPRARRGMACGLPCDRRRRFGPAEIVDDGAHRLAGRPTTTATPWPARSRRAAPTGRARRRGARRPRDALERYAWPRAGRAIEQVRARRRAGRRARPPARPIAEHAQPVLATCGRSPADCAASPPLFTPYRARLGTVAGADRALAPAWRWSRRSCCARSSTTAIPERDTTLLTLAGGRDDRRLDRHRRPRRRADLAVATSSASA